MSGSGTVGVTAAGNAVLGQITTTSSAINVTATNGAITDTTAAETANLTTSGTATLLALSAANWAYTWLRPGENTDALADRFFGALLDGMRGYATPG